MLISERISMLIGHIYFKNRDLYYINALTYKFKISWNNYTIIILYQPLRKSCIYP